MNGTRQEAIRAIGQSDLFRGAQSKVIELVAESARPVTSGAHDWLFEAGQAVNSIYVLESGLVCMAEAVGSGQYAVIAVHGPGRVFGWSGLISPNAYLTSAYALTATTAWEIPVDALGTLLAVESRLASVVYRNALELTYQNRQVCAAHLRRGEDTASHEEGCPIPSITSRFEWRLSGAMVEVRCPNSGKCQAGLRARCPLAPHGPSRWTPFMLRRFAAAMTSPRTGNADHAAAPLPEVAA